MRILLAFLILSAGFAYGQNFERFDKRFTIVRSDDGKISHIKAKGILSGFHFMPYVEGIKQELISLKKDLIDKSKTYTAQGELASEAYVDTILDAIQADSYSSAMLKNASPISPKRRARQRRDHLRRAYLNLPTVDIDAAYKEMNGKGFFKKVGDILKRFYLQRDVRIISAPYYKSFFYEQKVTNRVASELLKFAKKRFGSLPVLNIASFIIDDLMGKIEEQREIAQNIFLYYIVNYEENLNFSKAETNMMVSSVYESRIPVTGFQQSRNAKKNWEAYGWAQYDKLPRMAVDRMRMIGKSYASSAKVDFTFYEVEKDGKRMIVNAAMTNHMFSGAPAETFYFDNPLRVRTLRTLVKLGQMALAFVPKVPSFVKSSVNSFSESWYKQQAKSEAFLFAHFEAKGDQEMMKILGDQINNPFFLFFEVVNP